MNQKSLINDEHIALSNDDIAKLLKKVHDKANIVYLTNLGSKTSSIWDLFGQNNHLIIFVSTQGEYTGHWQLLLRSTSGCERSSSNDRFYFFDSYGHNFTALLEKVFDYFGKDAYHESYRLGELVLESKIPSIMNLVRYQSNDNDVETCGRHVVCCFYAFIKNPNGFNFNVYFEYMNAFKGKLGLDTYDEVVSYITEKMASE